MNVPCCLCNVRAANLINFEDWDVISHPFVERTWDDYVAACTGAEKWVTITREQHTHLRGTMGYDRRRGRGYSLSQDFDDLLLKKGDRLEPWSGCPDIAGFDRLNVFLQLCYFGEHRAKVFATTGTHYFLAIQV